MHDILISYINSRLINKLSEEDIDIIKDTFVVKKLRKHQFLLQEGEVCKFAGFITKGALKQYTVDDTGKEHILGLYIENWWAGDRESFVNSAPSPYFIQALEQTEMLVLSKDTYMDNLAHRQFMSDMVRILIEKQSLELLKTVHIVKTFTAEQRLAELEKNHPEFLQRFPQHIIASYLGMTKETLSRIRSNYSKK